MAAGLRVLMCLLMDPRMLQAPEAGHRNHKDVAQYQHPAAEPATRAAAARPATAVAVRPVRTAWPTRTRPAIGRRRTRRCPLRPGSGWRVVDACHAIGSLGAGFSSICSSVMVLH